jgi:signal peptidase I
LLLCQTDPFDKIAEVMNGSHIETQIKKQPNFFIEICKFTIIILFFVVPFRIFVAQPFIVNGASMDPTFAHGQYLIVDQVTYHFTDPKRGDVIVFRYPNDPSKFFIKRIIGLPGETITIEEGVVSVRNNDTLESIILTEPYVVFEKSDSVARTLHDDEYFVMGDNRGNSSDSRVWGALNEEFIVGKPALRLLPLNKISIHPGKAALEINN